MDTAQEIRNAVEDGHLLVSPNWEGFPGQAFGGFVAAAVLVAAATQTEKTRPLSLFARFQRPIPLDRAVALTMHRERQGRSVDTIATTLVGGERELARFTASFGLDGASPLQAQAVPVMPPLREPKPIWRLLEEIGVEPGLLMRRVGYRGETSDPEPSEEDRPEWHLRSEWPAPTAQDLAIRAATALMPIDVFVGPAAIRANGIDINGPWPVMMPSLDLTAWFYAPESPSADADAESPSGWWRTRTSVPVSHAGYTVGRTQVWSGTRMVAEGMSQVAILPMPAQG